MHMRPSSLAIAAGASLLIAALATSLAACDRPPETEDPSQATPEGVAGGAESEDAETSKLPDPESLLEPGIQRDHDPSSACLDACIDARRMEAMDATAIEILCAEDCHECETACVEDGDTPEICSDRCAEAMTPEPPDHLP